MVTDVPSAGPPLFLPPDEIPAGRVRRRHPVARVVGAVLGWIAAGLAGLGLLARFLDTGHQTLILLAAGAWVLAPLSVVALVLHLWRRGWFSVVAVLLLVVGQIVVYGPLFVARTPPAGGETVRVLSQNMLYGEAAPGRLVQRLRTLDVDVFAAQELTPGAVAGLRRAGLDDLLPYSVLDARPESAGTGLWSRYPISDPVRLADRGLAGVQAAVRTPGGTSFTALSLHPSSPFPGDPGAWYVDLDRIRTMLLALPPGPVLAAGDFNATVDHARFRRLLVDGWRDGAEQAGAGLVRSWPSNRSVPALVGIDHVLTRGPVATSVTTVPAPRSDHDGLVATVVVPR
ncbi:endonuclease/exonuclease/phosphatase family protein [Jatrophihabitans sp. YIM 134969]